MGMLADNGYPDAFVDLLYVTTGTDAHLEWVERLAGTTDNSWLTKGRLAMADGAALLAPLRVSDLGGPNPTLVSRLLADLGADVLKIEPPAGSAARSALPNIAGASIPFALHNANKRSAVLDPDSPPTVTG